MRALARIEHQPSRLSGRDELDVLALGLAGRARVDRVLIADFDRHPAIALPADRDRGQPAAISEPASLDLVQSIIDQRRPMQPLAEEPSQIAV